MATTLAALIVAIVTPPCDKVNVKLGGKLPSNVVTVTVSLFACTLDTAVSVKTAVCVPCASLARVIATLCASA